ncbi:MAG: SPFH domain-containing protein [Lachnospiraceae bacterium]|nr:SPFH domain-containing protein [Lachnospiraceae bacterium]
MGLIKSVLGVAGQAAMSTLQDQWKEFFVCDSMDESVLVTKGIKRSKNNKGSDNVISNGSGIVVADGQCMIIVEQGKVVEICAEPGEFTYDTSSEPSIFAGNLGESIVESFKTMGKRFTFGGDTAKDQRVYYFNTKEIIDNKFGTANPVNFKISDKEIGLNLNITLKCSGIYTYKIVDPLLFYTNVCGNVESQYRRDKIDSTLKAEFIASLSTGLAALSAQGMMPDQITGDNPLLADAMREALSDKWTKLRGISIVSIAMAPPVVSDKDLQLIQDAQRAAFNSNANMAAGTLVSAQADAMRAAANNANGAMNGFMGMNMAQGMGGVNAASLFQMGQNQAQPQGSASAQVQGWTCSCGAVNQGNFCSSCGAKRPAGAPLYKCDKCGWTPEDPTNPPKFCPQCGDPFTDDDKQ